MKVFTARLLPLLFLLVLFLSELQAQQPVFETADWEISAFTTEQRTRYQKIQAGSIGSSTHFIQFGTLAEQQNEGEITIEIPDNACGTSTFKARSVDYQSEEDYRWYGELKVPDSCSCQSGFVLLMSKRGEKFGHIQLEDNFYSIEDLSGGKNVLVQADASQRSSCGIGESALVEEAASPIIGRNTGNCDVRTLILFTAAARDAVSNINNTAEAAIELTNQAFINSGISPCLLQLTLAGVEEVNVRERGRRPVDLLFDLRNNPQAQQLRDQFNADIVVLLADNAIADFGRTAGIAFSSIIPGRPTPPSSAFAIVRALGVNDGFVFSHEVGHLLAGDHEPCTALDAGVNCESSQGIQHAHSFVFEKGCIFKNEHRKQTIMFSETTASDGIPNYSNPSISVNGRRTGLTGERNNAAILRNNGCTVAANRDIDIQLLSASISNDGDLCPCNITQLRAVTSGGGAGLLDYEWQISDDGINWGSVLSTARHFGAEIPCDETEPSYFVRVRVASSDGQIVFATYFIEMQDDDACERSRLIKTNEEIINFEFKVYPNPVNANFFTEFTLRNPAVTKISLIDANGRVVRTLVNSIFSSGKHRLRFLSEGIPSGLYRLSIENENTIQHLAICIVK